MSLHVVMQYELTRRYAHVDGLGSRAEGDYTYADAVGLGPISVGPV